MSEQKTVRVVVAGGGSIAQQRHLPEYAANPNAEIAGVFDFNRKRAQELCERFGGIPYTSLEAVLADPGVDAVSICTPNFTHADYAIKVLRSGKHVLVEKPMAQDLTETRAMMQAQKESGKVMMLGHNQRLVKAHMKAKELLDTGAIGDLLFYQLNFKHAGPETWTADPGKNTWFFQKSKAKFGVMGDLGAHKIDLIRYLTGSEVKNVFANMMTLDKKYEDGTPIDLEDNAVCMFNLENGLPGIMHFSWTNYGSEDNGSVIYGTKGVMKIFGDYTDDIVLEMRDGVQVKYSVGGIQTNQNQTKSGVIDEFIAAIVEGREPIVTGIDGHNTLAVLEAAVKSAELGQWVEIEY